MGLEQGLIRGLLGGVGGAAESVAEQEKFERENKAKEAMAATERQAQSDRDAAIEFARSQREATQAETQHGYRMEEIKQQGLLGGGKESKPAEAQLVDYYSEIMFDGDKKKAAEWIRTSKSKSEDERRDDFIAKAASSGMLSDEEILEKANKFFPGKQVKQPEITKSTPTIKSRADFEMLAPGTVYIAPDGTRRIKG